MKFQLIRTDEDMLDRLNNASDAYSSIMLSSMHNSFRHPDFEDIIDFEEFVDVHQKLNKWYLAYDKRLNELKNKLK